MATKVLSTTHTPVPPFATPAEPAEPTHPYTCNSCGVAFKTSDLQRVHMQTDWHRYNLKRRIASLPPLSSQIFNEKVLANQASAAATAARAQFERTCVICSRTYFSENAYTNHLSSGKHRQKVLEQQKRGINSIGEDVETESMVSSKFSLGEPILTPGAEQSNEEDEADNEFDRVVESMKATSIEDPDPIPKRPSRPRMSKLEVKNTVHPLSPSRPFLNGDGSPLSPTLESPGVEGQKRCLFCPLTSPSLQDNIHHMSSSHSLFIPEQNYLVDLAGLITYLHKKVYRSHECLYCGRTFHTTTGVQGHMRDKGHTMIAFEEEEDQIWIGQFYDFSSTWDLAHDDGGSSSDSSEAHDAVPAQGGTRLGAHRAATYIDGTEADDEDGEWEDDSDKDDGDDASGSDSDSAMPGSEHGASTPTPADQARKSFKQPIAFADETSLYLPSGRTAGHRSLARYYRQNLHNYPGAVERMELASRPRLLQRQLSAAANAEDQDGDTPMDGESTSVTTATSDRSLARRDMHRQLVSTGNVSTGPLADARRAALKIEAKERNRARRHEFRRNDHINFQEHYRDPLLQ